MTCVTTAAASILVNGSPTPPFKLHRGLRQGDPLSPFLFVLIVEALDKIINKATSMGTWNGVDICKNGFKLTHLQFADDTLMFCEANMESLKNIKKALILFQLASGLQVNFHKSSLIGINTSNEWLQRAAESLLCKTGCVLFTYLGLPIGGNSSRIGFWDPIIEKLSNKLASWKGRMLSIGGRLTLIKSSLANLPLYFMSLFPLPKGVIEMINKITRAFLWCGEAGKKSLSLVAWDLVQLPKDFGGLSVGNILHKNLALMFKWIWHFFYDPSSLWCQVNEAKYKYQPNLSIADLKVPKTGGPWKLICAAVFHNTSAKSIIMNGVRKSLGNGSSILFRQDPWISPTPLRSLFPRLYSICINKNASVASQGLWEGFNWIWAFEWRRALRPQDILEKAGLDQLLQPAYPSIEAQDSLIWAYSKSGKFSSKSFTRELVNLKSISNHDAIKGLWRGLVPHRVEIFAKLGIISLDQDVCPLCSGSSKTSNHLLLHCDYSRKIWMWWLNLWQLQWVFSDSLKKAYEQWIVSSRSKFFKKVWHASFFIIVWSEWKERNLRIFWKHRDIPQVSKGFNPSSSRMVDNWMG